MTSALYSPLAAVMAAGINTEVGGVEFQSSAVHSIFAHQKNANSSF